MGSHLVSTLIMVVKELTKQKEQLRRPGIRRTSPVIYRVTTGSKSEQTKATYQSHINDFLAFYKITDVSGIEPLKEYSPKLIRQMVLDYVLYLRDVKKISRSSIKVHCAALSHFFYMIRDDDTRLNWTKVKEEFPPDERIRRDRAYTVEEIQKMLSKGCAGRLRERAIILLLTSTGMRIGGIHPLTVGNLTRKDTPQGKVYRIEVYANSSAHYYCYCNVETAKAIDDYLQQERTDKGEILHNDSPLIRDLKTLNVKNVKPLTSYNVKYIVGRVVKKSGVQSTFQFTGEAKRSKGLRKFYKSQAESSGMKPINVELTHGHSIGISRHYYRPAESDVLQDYMSHAAEALEISPEHRLRKQLQQQEERHSKDYEDIRRMHKQMEEDAIEMRKQLNEILRPRGLKAFNGDLVDINANEEKLLAEREARRKATAAD